jgi:hypothetical protein
MDCFLSIEEEARAISTRRLQRPQIKEPKPRLWRFRFCCVVVLVSCLNGSTGMGRGWKSMPTPSISTKEIPVRPLSAHIHSVTEETRLESFFSWPAQKPETTPGIFFLNGDTFGHFQDKTDAAKVEKIWIDSKSHPSDLPHGPLPPR